MRKEIFQKIKIPEGVEVEIIGNTLIIKGKEGENKRKFNIADLVFEKRNDEIVLGSENATKKEKKKINTFAAHIKNMIKGVQEKFEYTLKACYSHFPITIEVQGDKAIIKNFLGEKSPRIVKIPKGIEIDVDREIIKIKSVNKELAGMAATNFEKATKIRKKDRRIFQDGIYMTNKAGREI